MQNLLRRAETGTAIAHHLMTHKSALAKQPLMALPALRQWRDGIMQARIVELTESAREAALEVAKNSMTEPWTLKANWAEMAARLDGELAGLRCDNPTVYIPEELLNALANAWDRDRYWDMVRMGLGCVADPTSLKLIASSVRPTTPDASAPASLALSGRWAALPVPAPPQEPLNRMAVDAMPVSAAMPASRSTSAPILSSQPTLQLQASALVWVAVLDIGHLSFLEVHNALMMNFQHSANITEEAIEKGFYYGPLPAQAWQQVAGALDQVTLQTTNGGHFRVTTKNARGATRH